MRKRGVTRNRRSLPLLRSVNLEVPRPMRRSRTPPWRCPLPLTLTLRAATQHLRLRPRPILTLGQCQALHCHHLRDRPRPHRQSHGPQCYPKQAVQGPLLPSSPTEESPLPSPMITHSRWPATALPGPRPCSGPQHTPQGTCLPNPCHKLPVHRLAPTHTPRLTRSALKITPPVNMLLTCCPARSHRSIQSRPQALNLTRALIPVLS